MLDLASTALGRELHQAPKANTGNLKHPTWALEATHRVLERVGEEQESGSALDVDARKELGLRKRVTCAACFGSSTSLSKRVSSRLHLLSTLSTSQITSSNLSIHSEYSGTPRKAH